MVIIVVTIIVIIWF